MAGYADERRRGFFEASDIDGPASLHRPRAVPSRRVRGRAATTASGAAPSSSARPRCARALDRAGWRADDVDFLATTTCTGRLTPSLDAHLVARLGCRRDVQRVHVGDTGCAAAVVALQQAWNHLRAFPGHRALVLAVEICSAAYFLDDRLESAVAHAIFADGAGALALSGDGAGPAIVAHRTLFRSEHLDAMGFEYPGGRPRVVLSKDVRRIGAAMMAEMATRADGEPGAQARGRARTGCCTPPAGACSTAPARCSSSTRAALAHARAVLREYGNMSSATILFVLERVAAPGRARCPGSGACMIGLGPGFAAEGALLRW